MPAKAKKETKDIPLPEMLPIEGGHFSMGGNKYDDEKPIHQVELSTFYLSQFPVANTQYAAFLQDYQSDTIKAGAHQGQAIIYEHRWGVQQVDGTWQPAKGFENHPVINVTWYGAVAYCEWLSEKEGQPYRLPSEAEWEYAARGGNKSKGFPYAGGYKLKEVAWYDNNNHGQTSPVGLKQPNELGLYDMSGNVDEWCADHWHENYKGAPNDGSAWLTGGEATRRVIRGGSWYNDDYSAASRIASGTMPMTGATLSVFEWPGTNPLVLLIFYPF